MDLQKKKLMNFRPAVFITAGLIIGILLGYAVYFINVALAVVLLVVFSLCYIGLAVYFAVKSKNYKALLCFICMIFMLFGVTSIIFKTYNPYTEKGVADFNGTAVEIYSEEKVDNGYSYSLLLKGDFLDVKNELVYLSVFSYDRIYYGSKISFEGKFNPLELGEFSFSTGAKYKAEAKSSVKVGKTYGLIPELKFKLLTSFEKLMPETYHLNYALITGETTYIPKGDLSRYQNVSVSHLFAVSGLHIGLTFGALAFLFKLFKAKSIVSFPLIELILLFYVGFCGFSASSLRAFIIISVRQTAKLLGVKSDKTTNLALSALIVLLISPEDLFSLGFLLSFSVYAGLILLANPFEKGFSKIFPKWTSKLLAPCIVAELISIPILIDYIGKCSAFGFLFNLLIVPIVSAIFPFIVLSSVLIAVFNAQIFAIFPNLSFMAIDWFLSLANTEIFMLNGFKFGVSSLFYYLFFYTFAGKFNLQRKSINILRIIVLSAFILSFCVVNLSYCIDFF